jgi:hypothetical protein
VGEDFPAVEHDDDDEEDQRGVGGEGLEPGVEGPVCARDSLGVAGFAEAEEGDEDGDPGEEGGDGRERLEPSEDVIGARRDGHVGEQADGGCDQYTVDWHTGLGAGQEDLGSLPVLCQGEEITRTGVQERIAGGSSRCEDDCVDDVREYGDTW